MQFFEKQHNLTLKALILYLIIKICFLLLFYYMCIMLLIFNFGCVYVCEYHVMTFINMHSSIFQSLWLQYFLSKGLSFFYPINPYFLSFIATRSHFQCWIINYLFSIMSIYNINHKAKGTKYHYKLRWISVLFFVRHMYSDVNHSMNTEQGHILFISICKENHILNTVIEIIDLNFPFSVLCST